MSFSPRSSFVLWIVVLLAALGYLLFLTTARLHRVDGVTSLVETDVAVDPASPTGYAGGLRNLIVPAHNNESYQWIIQTQQMLAQGGDWRIRKVNYDNAPVGRTVLTPSPYRWWLGLIAEVDHLFSGRPIGLSTERAARIADPVCHVLLLLAAAAFVGWRFGLGSATLLAVALVTLFPLGGTFLAGQPGDGSLLLVCLSASVLLLLAGLPGDSRRAQSSSGVAPTLETGASPWFFAAGVAGGLGLWIDAIRSLPVVVGIGLAGLAAISCSRRATKAGATPALLPWRHWALGGAGTILVAYLLEYFPDHLGTFSVQEVHPLYGVAWLGLGEVLTQSTRRPQQGTNWRDGRSLTALSLAVLAIAAVPVSIAVAGTGNPFAADPNATRLTNFAGSPIAQDLWAWVWNDGISLTVGATCLPLLLLLAAVSLFVWSRTDWTSRVMLALGLGPALVMLGFSYFRIRGWNEFDAVLLGLLVALTTAAGRTFHSKLVRGVGVAGLLLVLAPGATLLTKEAFADRTDPATESEIAALIERDLAHWLARQAGPDGAVVLAPPNLTTSLIYHGGLSGLGTPFWENNAGFAVSMRIAGASSPDEAQAVSQGRNLGFIVVPSWDNFLEEYARMGASESEHSLIALLHRWLPPRWLRPVPYHLPKVAGFEAQSVAVFRAVDVQDNETALSRLAEYFLEMEMIEQAQSVAYTLARSFPADLGAAVARTLVARSTGDSQAFAKGLQDVQASLERGDGESLAWDRRVSLAIALSEGRRFDQAREEVKKCLDEIDGPRLRSLTTVSLHRLLVMSKSFGLEINDPRLRSLALGLLPQELRDLP